MTPLTLPRADVPLCWLVLAGQRVPAQIDMQWMRAFLDLVGRSGGTVGVDFNQLIQELGAAPLPLAAIQPADQLLPAFEPQPAQNPLLPAFEPMPAEAPRQDALLESLQAAVAQLQIQMNDLQQGAQA